MASSSIKVTLLPPSGEKIERIFDQFSILVGRSSKCDLPLDTESLSRQHCRIDFENGNFYITDLGSTNGVFIQGERIAPNEKTQFNNFLPLQISVYECLVQEVEITAIRSPAILKADTLSLLTKPTKKINLNALNKSLNVKPPKKKSALADKFKFAISGVIFLGVLYFALFQEREATNENISIEERDTVNSILNPKKEKIIPKSSDEFLTPNIYVQLYGQKNCKETLYCENLLLNIDDGEGLAKENNDYIVFIKNSFAPENEKYAKVPLEDIDLVALDLFLMSRILDDYLTLQIDQIHVVIVNADNIPRSVYRFHPNKFSLQSVDRQALNSLLTDALYQGKTKEFWDFIDGPVQKLDLPQ